MAYDKSLQDQNGMMYWYGIMNFVVKGIIILVAYQQTIWCFPHSIHEIGELFVSIYEQLMENALWDIQQYFSSDKLGIDKV